MLKILKPGFNSTWTMNFQMFKLDLEMAKEPEFKLPTSAGSLIKQESSRNNIHFCFTDHAKAVDCVDHNKLWKTLKEMRIPDHLTCLSLDFYSIVIYSWKSGYVMPPALSFLFKTSLASQGFLWFHMNLRIIFSISMENTIEFWYELHWICISLWV